MSRLLRSLALLWLGAFVSVGCRSRDTVGGVEIGFRANGETIDFGRALEGSRVVRTALLTATGAADITVAAEAGGAFSVPESIDIPGGGTVELAIAFTAGTTPTSGELRLSAHDHSVSIPLTGEGVHPLDCVPLEPCRVSHFSLEADGCLESLAADGTSCEPASKCLERGICQTGVCLGSPRICDDKNVCTDDACSEIQGCVHTIKWCEQPNIVCHAAVCHADRGCVVGPVPDGTSCGGADCVSSFLCVGGNCATVPTPEGFLCSPATPCQGEGRCKSQVCARPDAGEWTPTYAVSLAGGPPTDARRELGLAPAEVSLLEYNGNLFYEDCGLPDGGCQLTSQTTNGFLRFNTLHADVEERRLVAVWDAGVVLRTAHALEAYSVASGEPLWSLAFSSLTVPAELPGAIPSLSHDALALSQTGELWANFSWRAQAPVSDAGDEAGDAGADSDGGMEDGGESDGGTADAGPPSPVQTLALIGRDGGTRFEAMLRERGSAGLLAVDASDQLCLFDPSGPLTLARVVDGGTLLLRVGSEVSGDRALTVAQGRLWSGSRHLRDLDGGAVVAELPWALDGGEEVLLNHLLMAGGSTYAFFRTCPLPPCLDSERATALRVGNSDDGGVRWQALVEPQGPARWLEEAALVVIPDAGSPLGVAALTQSRLDGGWQARAQLFLEGGVSLSCPLPEGTRLGGALFDQRFLFALVNRGEGWRLEAYDLKGLTLHKGGWPMRQGLNGARRESK